MLGRAIGSSGGRWTRRGVLAAALVTGGGLAAAGPASAEPFLDVFTGRNFTRDADVTFRQPAAGSDFTVHGLSFAPRLSEGAPYYGARAGYFFGDAPARLGLALEFFHFKVVAETADARRISGTLGGDRVDTTVPVNAVVQRFSISNGVSYVMLDGLARYGLLADRKDYPHGRIQLYAGAGAGPVVAYTYSTIAGTRHTTGYELAGAGLQGFAGVRVLLFRHVGLFVEGKYTAAWLTVGVAGGGEGELTEQSAHLVGGLSVTLP